MDLSIIIINYRTYELSKNTILSILKYPPLVEYEIFLVDNNSSDSSFEKLKAFFKEEIKNNLIKPIGLDENKGFAGGNNVAIKKSKGDHILLLNSDTIVKKGTLNETLVYIKKNRDIGALGSKILLPNGELDKASKRNFPNPVNSFYRLFHLEKLIPEKSKNSYNIDLDDNGVYEVDSLVGAFMIVRKQAINEIGLLDEDFFMYGEDIDWCWRIKKGNWKVVYYGKKEIIHYKGTNKKQAPKLIYHFYKSMYLFYNKHYKNSYSFITTIAVYLGIGLLFILKLIKNFFESKNP